MADLSIAQKAKSDAKALREYLEQLCPVAPPVLLQPLDDPYNLRGALRAHYRDVLKAFGWAVLLSTKPKRGKAKGK